MKKLLFILIILCLAIITLASFPIRETRFSETDVSYVKDWRFSMGLPQNWFGQDSITPTTTINTGYLDAMRFQMNNENGTSARIEIRTGTSGSGTVRMGIYSDGAITNCFDRKFTAESSINVTTIDTWYGWSVTPALAQGWYDGTIAENGIVLIDLVGTNYYWSTEYTIDPTKCPFWTITYTTGSLKISGTTNVEDAQIISSSPEYNYGSYTNLSTTLTNRTLIRVKNLATLLPGGVTITSAVCSLYCYTNATDGIVSASRVFKPWVEGTQLGATCSGSGASWNDWNCTAYEWGTVGCACSGDDGSDNTYDGTCTPIKPNALLWEGTDVSFITNSWIGQDVTTITLVAGTYYWLAFKNSAASRFAYGRNAPGYSHQYRSGQTYALAFPNPFGTYSGQNTNRLSMRLWYTTGGVEDVYSGKFPRGIFRGIMR